MKLIGNVIFMVCKIQHLSDSIITSPILTAFSGVPLAQIFTFYLCIWNTECAQSTDLYAVKKRNVIVDQTTDIVHVGYLCRAAVLR